MERLKFLRRGTGHVIACGVLYVAQFASTHFSVIFYQSEVPEKVRLLKERNKN